jgi:hypothetical protein
MRDSTYALISSVWKQVVEPSVSLSTNRSAAFPLPFKAPSFLLLSHPAVRSQRVKRLPTTSKPPYSNSTNDIQI